jgi:hypothetical protein
MAVPARQIFARHHPVRVLGMAAEALKGSIVAAI